MRQTLLLVVALLLGSALSVAGCHRNDAACDDDNPCTNPARPFCDSEGATAASGGIKNLCVPQPCLAHSECDGLCDMTGGECAACTSDDECTRAGAGATCEEGRCVSCESAADCSADQPVCSAGACTECEQDAACQAIDPEAPVCSGGRCVQCVDHDDCASQLCDSETSRCIAESSIVYIDGGASGSPNPGCGAQGAPCKTIGLGVDEATAARNQLRVAPGTYQEKVRVSGGPPLVLWMDGASAGTLTTGPILAVRDEADVTVRDARLSTVAANNATCVEVDSSSNLTMHDVEVQGCNGIGIDVSGTATLSQVIVSGNGIGIDVSGTLRMDRSIVRRNTTGGIDLQGNFEIVNSFIVQNGGPGAQFGGARVLGEFAPATFEFVTIANNSHDGVGGVACLSGPAALSNSILWGNMNGQVSGACTVTSSLVEGEAGASAPSFVDPQMGDFHLAPGSSGIDGASAGATVSVDFDGDARPQGAASDLGADEVVN